MSLFKAMTGQSQDQVREATTGSQADWHNNDPGNHHYSYGTGQQIGDRLQHVGTTDKGHEVYTPHSEGYSGKLASGFRPSAPRFVSTDQGPVFQRGQTKPDGAFGNLYVSTNSRRANLQNTRGGEAPREGIIHKLVPHDSEEHGSL